MGNGCLQGTIPAGRYGGPARGGWPLRLCLLIGLGGAAASLLGAGAARAGGSVRSAGTTLTATLARPVSGDLWRRDFDGGTICSGDGELRILQRLAASWGGWQAGLAWQGQIGAHLTARGELREAWVAYRAGRVTFGFGRRTRLWAPAAAGELLISPHARSLDQVWFETGSWRLSHAGRLSAESFLGYLDDCQRVVPYPLLWGMRASWEPRSWLRLEAQRTIMLGGGGRTQRLTTEDWIDMFIVRAENLRAEPYPPSESDQKFAWHAVVELGQLARPIGLEDLELFGTYAGEDAFDGIAPSAPAKSLGIRLKPVATTALWFVFARTTDDRQHWYHHKIYRSGYTYRGVWMGHPMGGDAKSWRGGLVCAQGGILWSLDLRRERRGYFWDRCGTYPHVAGGVWQGAVGARTRLGRVAVELEIGAAQAWGGLVAEERLAEGIAVLSLTWCANRSWGVIDGDWRWGPVR